MFCYLLKARTPLEQEVFNLLHKNKQPVTDPLLTPVEKASLKAMSLEEVSVIGPIICPDMLHFFQHLPSSPGVTLNVIHYRLRCAEQSFSGPGPCSPTMRPGLEEKRKSRAKSKEGPIELAVDSLEESKVANHESLGKNL